MKGYYTRIEDGAKFVLYKDISNGKILTKFNEQTGTPIVNADYQLFIIDEHLKLYFKEFEFKLSTGDAIGNIIRKALPDLVYQFRNYGLLENQAQAFEEFRNSAQVDIYREMIKHEAKADFDHLAGDDNFEFGDAEEFFDMFAGGFVPILKKMLIELDQANKVDKREE